MVQEIPPQQETTRVLGPRDFIPSPQALRLMYANQREVLVDGPRGTGKTRAVLEKILGLAVQWPKSRHLLIRKVRRTMNQTVLDTWENEVLPEGYPIGKIRRAGRESYQIQDSEVLCLGLDDPNKFRSMQADTASIFEGTETTVDDLELVKGALRNGKGSYHQLIVDTNPAGPNHYLIVRARGTKMRRLQFLHQDNPRFWDAAKREWTREGAEYIANLDELTGVRLDRYRKGLWRTPEGVVFPEFDHEVHVVDRFVPPAEWRRVRTVDFGYENPFVCQWWAIDGDDNAFLYREIYQAQLLVMDAAKWINELSAGENIETTICDHDAEDRATLERFGISTEPAEKDVATGLEEMRSRLRLRPCSDGTSRPKLRFMRDSLVQLDVRLDKRGRPTSTPGEFESYCWREGRGGEKTDEPIKRDDHGMDATRYLAKWMGRESGEPMTIEWVGGSW